LIIPGDGLKDIDEAAALIAEVLAEHPEMHGIRPILAMCLTAQGKPEAARAELRPEVERNADVDADIAYLLGAALALLGEKDDAFRWLKRSVEIGNGNRSWFEHDPNLVSLSGDPRYHKLLSLIDEARKGIVSPGNL